MALSQLIMLFSYLGACSAAITRHAALLPVSDQTPPPDDALAWVEEVKKGWVMVIDFGQGERWLRALHPRAATSVKFWRLPDKVYTSTEAPYWVSGAPAYILATDLSRALNYMLYKPKGFNLKVVKDIPVVFEKRLQMDSTARTVIGIFESYYDNGMVLVFLQQFWSLQISFYALVVRERSCDRRERSKGNSFMPQISGQSEKTKSHRKPFTDQWERLYFDPFEGRNGRLRSLRAHLKPSEVTAVVGYRFSDLGRRPLNIILHGSMRCRPIDLRHYGRHDWTIGVDLRAVIEVARTINSINTWDTILDFHEENHIGITSVRSALLLYNRSADILALRISTNANFPMIQSTFLNAGHFFLVPRASQKPAWSLPLRGLSASVWQLLAGSMVVYAITWYILTGKSFVSCIADTLALFSTHGIPKETSTVHRLHMAGSMLVSALVLVVIYQGRLFTITTKPEYEKQIASLQDIAESGLPIHLSNVRSLEALRSWSLQHASEEDAIAAKAIVNRMKHEKGMDLAHKRAYVVAEEEVTFWMATSVSRLWVPIWSIKIPDTLSMPVSVNWPWRHVFSKRFRWAIDSGLYEKWTEIMTNDLETFNRISDKKSLSYHDIPNTFPHDFAISDLWPHFQILFIGYIISTVVFVFELWKK